MTKLLVPMLILATVALPALAQDLAQVAPKDVKIEYENAKVRVVRLRIAANEIVPMQDRPARVVIALTANDVRLTSPDGKTRALHVPAGNIGWGGPTRRSVTNLDQPLENVIVEPKNATEPAKPVTNPPSPNDPRALIEPHHRWLFENQYVRVYDVHIPPGEIAEFHRHAYDTVIVHISGGTTSAQSQGGEWGKPETDAPGMVAFAADANQPRTHRVRNDGKQVFHVVLVQLMK